MKVTRETLAATAARGGAGMTAAEVMTPSPRTCSPFSTVAEAALIFRDEDCGAVPVLDQAKPVGVLTDRDVALALTQYPDLSARPVSDVMIGGVATVPTTATLDEIAGQFADRKVRRLLVLDGEGLLTGIVAWADLLPHLPDRAVGQVVSAVIDPPGKPAPKGPPPAGQVRINLARDGHATGRKTGGGSWLNPSEFWSILRETANSWVEDRVPRLGAALAFYSVLSLAPLLIIAIAIAALVFGEEAARGQIVEQIRGLVGKEGAEAIQTMIASARKPGSGVVAAVVGVVTLLFGASGVFGELQDALNTMHTLASTGGVGVLRMGPPRLLTNIE